MVGTYDLILPRCCCVLHDCDSLPAPEQAPEELPQDVQDLDLLCVPPHAVAEQLPQELQVDHTKKNVIRGN